jgi:hypothetical protein
MAAHHRPAAGRRSLGASVGPPAAPADTNDRRVDRSAWRSAARLPTGPGTGPLRSGNAGRSTPARGRLGDAAAALPRAKHLSPRGHACDGARSRRPAGARDAVRPQARRPPGRPGLVRSRQRARRSLRARLDRGRHVPVRAGPTVRRARLVPTPRGDPVPRGRLRLWNLARPLRAPRARPARHVRRLVHGPRPRRRGEAHDRHLQQHGRLLAVGRRAPNRTDRCRLAAGASPCRADRARPRYRRLLQVGQLEEAHGHDIRPDQTRRHARAQLRRAVAPGIRQFRSAKRPLALGARSHGGRCVRDWRGTVVGHPRAPRARDSSERRFAGRAVRLLRFRGRYPRSI